MDDLEFERRIYSDPADSNPDLVEYVKNDPTKDKAQQEVRKFDQRLVNTLNGIPIPDDLQQKLLAIVGTADHTEHVIQVLDTQPATSAAVAHVAKTGAEPKNSRNLQQYFAIAATLVVTFGLILSIFSFRSTPAASDLVIGTQVLYHLHQEPHHIGIHDQQLDPQQFRQVLASAGGQINGNGGIRADDFNFINPCVVLQGYRSVHMVTQGKNGPVNIFVIHNSPVKSQFDIADDDYQGVILPMADGNLILVGEKLENLNDYKDHYKDLFSEKFEWSI